MSLIDKFAPEWQFREMHRIAVLAPADAARRAGLPGPAGGSIPVP